MKVTFRILELVIYILAIISAGLKLTGHSDLDWVYIMFPVLVALSGRTGRSNQKEEESEK